MDNRNRELSSTRTERASFERWYKETYEIPPRAELLRLADGRYVAPHAEGAWQAWSARAMVR